MKVGFVALIGEPNVGKSTLLNNLIGFDLAIISSMAQTTRNQIKGIYNDDDMQIIFVDTPGIHEPKHKLGKVLNKNAHKTLNDVELICLLIPITQSKPINENLLNKIDLEKTILVMTKIDLVDNQDFLNDKANHYKKLGFKDIIAVSNKIPESIEILKKIIYQKLPEGTPYYQNDDITDSTIKFMSQEIIRYCVIENTFQEIPHSVAIVINQFSEQKDPLLTKIDATIFVERESQKGIMIGKNGSLIKKIGTEARKKIIELLKTPVHLSLKVKVDKNWTNDEKKIKKMGY